jgi:Rieske Fe-S protein
MSLNRREFMRRIVAGSALLITGLVSSWELLQNLSPNANGNSSSSTANPPPPPPTTETVSATVTKQETVTVTEKTVTATEYVAPPSTQKSSTSSETSAQTSQTSQQTSSQTASSSTSTSSTASSSSAGTPPGYVLVAAMSSLAGKSSAYFNHPKGGLSLLVNAGGQWYAGSATCTHRPCTVKWQPPSVYCPCHDGYFNPVNGAVTGGPPPRPLPQYGVLIQNNNLYVTA